MVSVTGPRALRDRTCLVLPVARVSHVSAERARSPNRTVAQQTARVRTSVRRHSSPHAHSVTEGTVTLSHIGCTEVSRATETHHQKVCCRTPPLARHGPPQPSSPYPHISVPLCIPPSPDPRPSCRTPRLRVLRSCAWHAQPPQPPPPSRRVHKYCRVLPPLQSLGCSLAGSLADTRPWSILTRGRPSLRLPQTSP